MNRACVARKHFDFGSSDFSWSLYDRPSTAMTAQALSHADGTQQWDQPVLEQLRSQLIEIRSQALGLEALYTPMITVAHSAFRASACNLVQYLSLRSHDLRVLQDKLASLGLSSLGRSESHVLATLDAIIRVLDSLLARDPGPIA